MKNVFFSVIIPVFNSEHTLERAIDSVLGQTFNDFEIVVIDDGSSDNSTTIVSKIIKRDSRVSLICQENKGPFIARQVGIEHAKGEYLLFLDSDDEFECNLMESIYDYCFKKIDLVIFRYKKTRNNSIKYSVKSFENETYFEKDSLKLIYETVLKSNELNSLCIKAIRREITTDIKVSRDEYMNLINGEDLIYSLEVLDKVKDVIYLDKALYIYIDNVNGTTRNFNERYFDSRKIVLNSLLFYMENWYVNSSNISDAIYLRFLSEVASGVPSANNIIRYGIRNSYQYLLNISRDDTFRKIFDNANRQLLKVDQYKIVDYIYQSRIFFLLFYLLIIKKIENRLKTIDILQV